jgi:hypothetical protein
MRIINSFRFAIGSRLARYLSDPLPGFVPTACTDPQFLRDALRPGDVLLIEGDSRFSVAIKYLTQSTWSHAAIYVGDTGQKDEKGEPCTLIEADVAKGVIAIPLSTYDHLHTRICRPVGLSEAEKAQLIAEVKSQLGNAYDLKHIVDLARFLFPTPPVPVRFRRRLLALGSGDPSRAVCSTMVAQAFQHLRYPILPRVSREMDVDERMKREILHIRHYSLFTPRDFDISPYFKIIKPTIEHGFDYHRLQWADGAKPGLNAASKPALEKPQRSS